MIGLIAKVKIAPENTDAFVEVSRELIELVRANEPKVELYTLTKPRGGEEGVYYFVERYRDQEAFDGHTQAPHFQKMAPKLGALIEGEPEILVVDEMI